MPTNNGRSVANFCSDLAKLTGIDVRATTGRFMVLAQAMSNIGRQPPLLTGMVKGLLMRHGSRS